MEMSPAFQDFWARKLGIDRNDMMAYINAFDQSRQYWKYLLTSNKIKLSRQVDDREEEFIAKSVKAMNHQLLYSGWVTLKSPNKTLRDRIIVVTTFRTMFLKVEESKITIDQACPIIGLLALRMSQNDPYKLLCEFSNDVRLAILCPSCVDILESILFAFLAVSHGMPSSLLPVINVPYKYLEEFSPPSPDDQTGLLANFLAVCDSLDIFPRPEILDYIISCFHLGIRELDFKTCLHMGSSKFHPQDIYALTKALWHSSYFKRLIVQDMTVTDESLHLISEILKFNSSITHFSLINLKSSKVGISPFVDNISSGIHCLKSLSIAKFHIGDIGIYQICSAFNKLDASLKRLILIEVGMTHKGLQDLVTLLSSSRWSKSLKELDISDNKIGKGQGSETLGSLLKSSHSLVSLNLVRCELDLVPALQALKSNSFLLDIKLETLNLSGNKFYQRCILELAEIIKSSRILKNLYCSKTNLKSDHFEELLTAIKNNPHGIAYFLDVSHNDLGSSCPNKISAVFKTASDKISTIVTTNNDLGTDGFQKFCNCAKMFIGLHTLVLDANVTAGIFSKNLQLGTALATLIKELSSLQILSICGDDKHYLKGALTPFFRYMASNKTLLQLNVSNNRLTDESFEALFEMIEQNDTLQVLNVDNNGWKYKSIKRLRDAILSNNGLIHTSAIPLNDLITIAGNYQKYESSIRMMISEMESRLRNNALMHQKESTSKEDKNAIDRVSKGSGGAGNFIVTSDSTGDYQRATAKSVAVFDEAAKKRHAQIDFEEIDYEIEKELELAENSVASDKSSISGLANSSKEIATGNRSLNSSQRFDLNSLNPEHCMYSYESLKNMNREETPEYLNITFKELYLRDEVFEELFADSKFRYLDWPRWKQVRKKRELGLF